MKYHLRWVNNWWKEWNWQRHIYNNCMNLPICQRMLSLWHLCVSCELFVSSFLNAQLAWSFWKWSTYFSGKIKFCVLCCVPMAQEPCLASQLTVVVKDADSHVIWTHYVLPRESHIVKETIAEFSEIFGLCHEISPFYQEVCTANTSPFLSLYYCRKEHAAMPPFKSTMAFTCCGRDCNPNMVEMCYFARQGTILPYVVVFSVFFFHVQIF